LNGITVEIILIYLLNWNSNFICCHFIITTYLPLPAKEVYHLISLLEENALKASSTSLETSVLEAAKTASQKLTIWLNQSRKLGGLTKKSYFLPIPVALVAVL